MIFSLNNRHRKCMGLKLVKDDYEIVENEFEEKYIGGIKKYTLYFDKDNLVKIVKTYISDVYISLHEMDVNYKTRNNKTILLPKTNKGRERKLLPNVVDSLNGEGNYFYIACDLKIPAHSYAEIANYTTQKSFYKERYLKCNSWKDMIKWCDKFADDSSEEDIKKVSEFANEKRVHVKYKEGDYFRIKFEKNNYLYGRILLDVYKGEKNGDFDYFAGFMGHNLIIEMFHIITTRTDVSIDELKKLKTFPSEHIMDNIFYYGDCEIIGNEKLDDNQKYPIIYGVRTINKQHSIVFQYGKIQKSLPYEKEKLLGNFAFRGSGFYFTIDNEKIIRQCIKEKSNKPFWDFYKSYNDYDIRSIKNKEIFKKILKQFNMEYLFELYKDY